MEKGGGGRYEDAEHNGRNGYGQTVEEAHIPSNPSIGNKRMLNDDDNDDDDIYIYLFIYLSI